MLDQTTIFVFISFILICIFVVIWIFVVAPSERRHHERKLELVQKRLNKRREARLAQETGQQMDQQPDTDGGD